MILHCIRHGVTPSNLAGRFNDSEDESIDASAVEVLKTLAIGAEAYDRVYVSPMRRCIETAEHLGLRDWTLEPRIAERGREDTHRERSPATGAPAESDG